ncbi:MAG: PD40 domain-containing protein [Pyrinomonadaceae bacterium]|nr:PD40 domain-containing protein [Pyrinomonadaceae bacterium]
MLRREAWGVKLFALLLIASLAAGAGCKRGLLDKRSVVPRSLRDVPAQRLAYNFQADAAAPAGVSDSPNPVTRLEAIQKDFDERRKDDALVRTVTSPDGQRALALYETGDTEQNTFRIDMYATAGGAFLRNVSPPELAGVFAATVAWSPDGNYIAFIARRSGTQQEAAPQPPEIIPEAPQPSPPVSPVFAPVQTFSTEQIYICNRDGFDLKPLTSRDGLIYFYLGWSPDSTALVSLACTEKEWNARPAELLPAGRPRLVNINGQERLLDDRSTDVLPVWSPDSSKVSTAFETEVAIYDAVTDSPTNARISLREPLIAASADYDEKNLKKKPASKSAETGSKQQAGALPVSFNPVVRLNWPRPETLYLETGFLRIYANEPVSNYLRWHKLDLSMQATQLSFLRRM